MVSEAGPGLYWGLRLVGVLCLDYVSLACLHWSRRGNMGRSMYDYDHRVNGVKCSYLLSATGYIGYDQIAK